MLIVFYSIFLIAISVWSYSLIDVNLTLFNHRYWEAFRQWIIPLGYYHRQINLYLYIGIVVGLFMFYYLFLRRIKTINPFLLSLVVGAILLFSYPALSHDLFNYIFDAKIITHYHQNPYFYVPEYFKTDPWLRFMHWTHRTYPYGPVFLGITLIPSFLAMGKFVLNFYLFKLLSVIFYWLAVYCLSRRNRRWAMIFAVHPLVLVEGLLGAHNDLIGVGLAIAGMSLVLDGKQWWGRLMLLLSAGIKFITLPFLFFTGGRRVKQLIFTGFMFLMLYLSLTREIQPWYFLNVFVLLPILGSDLNWFNLFFVGLLLSSGLFIKYGVLEETRQFVLKNSLLYGFFVVNAAVLFVRFFWKRRSSLASRLIVYSLVAIFAFLTHFYLLHNTFSLTGKEIGTLMLGNLTLSVNLVPVLFVAGIISLLFLPVFGFYPRVMLALLLTGLAPLLAVTRQFSPVTVLIVAAVIVIQWLVIILGRKKPSIITGENHTNRTATAFLIVLLVCLTGPIYYFSQPYPISALTYQKGIADAISQHKQIWEYNKRQNHKAFLKTNAVRLRVFPVSVDQAGLDYLLKQDHRLVSRDYGLTFILCYGKACKEDAFQDGDILRGTLILPHGERVSFDEIFPIFSVPGQITVYGYRG
ncbi:hypothetical protein M1523_02330 [Patescibacteria group bacterium]|nr:hypothetical protein [Patescibacteria group bacterium]MCL5091442.1 hypothetical protein [Patescibacteria group bacterium]